MFDLRIRGLVACLLVTLLLCSNFPPNFDARAKDPDYRWQGYDWVFVFSSDDGLIHNTGWDVVADSLDFNFTVFINQCRIVESGPNDCIRLPFHALQLLAVRGNEIGMHGYDHGRYGLDCSGDCPGPWGGFTNYWAPECWAEGGTFEDAMQNFQVEVSRDSMINWLGVDPLTAAYPAHLHSDSVMYHLERLGYLGARDGGGWWQSTSFTVNPLNSLDGGMSLYRMSTMTTTAALWGDHWDQDGAIPQHFSVETFRAKFDSILTANNVIDEGKMFCLYTHDFGADDDRYCDRNWHHGGLTPEELAETVTYAREQGAVIMTFGEAVAWYRDHTVKVDDPVAEYGAEFAGDLIWKPDALSPSTLVEPPGHLEQNHPNPFNPETTIGFDVPASGHFTLGVYDIGGRLIIVLLNETLTARRHVITWNGRDGNGNSLPSGTYYYRLTGANLQETRRMALVR